MCSRPLPLARFPRRRDRHGRALRARHGVTARRAMISLPSREWGRPCTAPTPDGTQGATAADEFAEGVRVGVGGLLEQPVEQQPPGSGGPPVEPEGELVEVVGQVLPADPVVQGAGSPSFEQRRDQVRSGHDRVEVTGEIARSGAMREAVVGESGEHEGAIGVDLGAGGR
jgi:hypothetical protein